MSVDGNAGSLTENIIGLIEAVGGTRPASKGLQELYQDLAVALAAFNPGVAVRSIGEGVQIVVDATDPTHPIVGTIGLLESVVEGSGIHVDNTDPFNPIISATGGGGGVESVTGTTGQVDVDNGDPDNPVISLPNVGPGAGGPFGDATHVAAITIDDQGRITNVSEVTITGGGGGSFPTSTGSGSPEGVLVGHPGDTYQDIDSGSDPSIGFYFFSGVDGTDTGWYAMVAKWDGSGTENPTTPGVWLGSNDGFIFGTVFILGGNNGGVIISDVQAENQTGSPTFNRLQFQSDGTDGDQSLFLQLGQVGDTFDWFWNTQEINGVLIPVTNIPGPVEQNVLTSAITGDMSGLSPIVLATGDQTLPDPTQLGFVAYTIGNQTGTPINLAPFSGEKINDVAADYVIPAFSAVTVISDFVDWWIIGTSTLGGGGTVTAVAVASANGFTGTVAGTSTQTITMKTSITGLLKGNGTAISAATAGTDYVAPGGALGTPTSGNLSNCSFPTLNQNTSGTAANLSGTPALPNGTTATTQSAHDNSTKLATTAYADAAGGSGGAFTQIANNVLSGTAASVTFSSIPGTSNHLNMKAMARSSATNADWHININSIVTGYDLVGIESTGSANSSVNQTNQTSLLDGVLTLAGSSDTAGVPGCLEITIKSYAQTTFDKTIDWHAHIIDAVASLTQSVYASGLVRSSTAAIITLVIAPSAGNFIAGSAFYLYGIT